MTALTTEGRQEAQLMGRGIRRSRSSSNTEDHRWNWGPDSGDRQSESRDSSDPNSHRRWTAVRDPRLAAHAAGWVIPSETGHIGRKWLVKEDCKSDFGCFPSETSQVQSTKETAMREKSESP